MKKIFMLSLIIMICSCISTQPTISVVPSNTTTQSTHEETNIPYDTHSNTMNILLKTGYAALDNMQTIEGIKAFVSVLAYYETIPIPNSENTKIKDAAHIELTKIGSRLFIEPSDEWLDTQNAKPKTLSTEDIGKEQNITPTISLYENFGSGRIYVTGATIKFSFQSNSGILTSFVQTNDSGKASSIISNIENPSKEARIIAYPEFTVKGYTYAFKNISCSFLYLPPQLNCSLFVLEKKNDSTLNSPLIVDSVNTLKKVFIDISQNEINISEEDFKSLSSGNNSYLFEKLHIDSKSYYAFIFIECYSISQVIYNGVAYNLFSAYSRIGFKLVRNDGTIVYTFVLDSLKGDGPSKESAEQKSLKGAYSILKTELDKKLDEIILALKK